MDEIDDMTSAREAARGTGRRRQKLLIGLGVAAVVLAGVAAVAIARNGDSSEEASRPVDAAREACRQWSEDDEAPPGARDGWCGHMADQMGHMHGQGRGGAHMWRSASTMRENCADAMRQRPPDGEDAEEWCDRMVGWMSERMDDWGGWHHWDD